MMSNQHIAKIEAAVADLGRVKYEVQKGNFFYSIAELRRMAKSLDMVADDLGIEAAKGPSNLPMSFADFAKLDAGQMREVLAKEYVATGQSKAGHSQDILKKARLLADLTRQSFRAVWKIVESDAFFATCPAANEASGTQGEA